ncbi:diacylglycerol kinase [Arenimonas sp.]|nr:diacylglycerol kinase [Candidatus Parcubacteria bacterium]
MSILKFLNSFKYALYGLKKIFREEQNFQIHSFCAGVVILLSIFKFHFNYIELSLTFICIALVLAIEIVNTAIENTWDHLEPNHNPVVKTVKDMMAAAVMIVSIFSAIVWVLLIVNRY